MEKIRAIILSTGLIACASLLFITRSIAEVDTKPDSKLAAAADEALKSTMAEYEMGKRNVEDIYRWSRRLMEARLAVGDVGARRDHITRMNDLHRRVDARFKVGAPSASAHDVAATT